jgi:hypothetical protein
MAGRRACVVRLKRVNKNKVDGDRYWGSPLRSLHVQFPFDIYVFGEKSRRAIEALPTRVERLGVYGAESHAASRFPARPLPCCRALGLDASVRCV